MAFDKKYIEYGVIKIEGKKIKIYSSSNSYKTINPGKEITNASWAGDVLNVSLVDGKVRRYTSTNSYKTI